MEKPSADSNAEPGRENSLVQADVMELPPELLSMIGGGDIASGLLRMPK
jgi:hypothetical protein